MYVEGIESIEIHEGTHRLFTVYTHGTRTLTLHVNRIEGGPSEFSLFADPKSEHGDRYSEVHFEDPTRIEIVNDRVSWGEA